MSEFTLTEKYDLKTIQKALQSRALDVPTTTRLQTLYRQVAMSPDKSSLNVTYAKKASGFGRYYPKEKGVYAACYQWSHLRVSLFDNNEYLDVDAEKCHPTILYNLGLMNNKTAPKLGEFIQNAKRFYDEMDLSQADIDGYNNHFNSETDRQGIAKHFINALMMGGRVNNLWTDKEENYLHLKKNPVVSGSDLDTLSKELKQLGKFILGLDQFQPYVKKFKSDPSRLSFILQDIEADAVLGLMDEMNKNEVNNRAYIYDGILVETKDKTKVEQICKGYVNEYKLKFRIKDHPKTLDKLKITCRQHYQVKTALKSLEDKVALTDEHLAQLLCTDRTDVHMVSGQLFKYSPSKKLWDKIEWENLKDDITIGKLIVPADPQKLPFNDMNYCKNGSGWTQVKKFLKSEYKKIHDEPYFVQTVNKRSLGKLYFKDGQWVDMRTMETGEINEDNAGFFCIPRAMPDWSLYDMEQPDVKIVWDLVLGCFTDDEMKICALRTACRAVAGYVSDKRSIIMPGERNSGKSALLNLMRDGIGVVPSGPITTISVPVIRENGDSDAKSLSWMIKRNLDTARVAIASEMKGDDRKAVVDGNIIKAMQSGDEQIARVNNKDEVTLVCNAQLFMAFNPPTSGVNAGDLLYPFKPMDSLQRCHIWCMPYTFTADQKEIEEAELKCDASVKAGAELTHGHALGMLITENNESWGNAFIWLLMQHWRDQPVKDVDLPKEWAQPQNEVKASSKNTELQIFYENYEFDEEGHVPAADFRFAMGLSMNKASSWLKRKFRHKLKQFTASAVRVDGQLVKCYHGFRKIGEDN